MRILAILAASALLLAGCAMDERPAIAEAEGRQCFWPRQVTGFSSVDGEDDRVILNTVGDDHWLLELYGPCPGLDFSLRLALVSRSPGMVCDSFDAHIVAPSPVGPQRCPVRVVRKLTDAEAEAFGVD